MLQGDGPGRGEPVLLVLVLVPVQKVEGFLLVQVMRAEAEAAEEADPAFNSQRSVPGKSCFSPEDASSRSTSAGRREENGRAEEDDREEEKEDEEEEEEGVVSWASVRMQGDQQRQKASREEDEVFKLLLKG